MTRQLFTPDDGSSLLGNGEVYSSAEAAIEANKAVVDQDLRQIAEIR